MMEEQELLPPISQMRKLMVKDLVAQVTWLIRRQSFDHYVKHISLSKKFLNISFLRVEIGEQLLGVGSLLPLCGILGWDSDLAW